MGTRQELLERLQGDIQFANRIVNEKDPASMDDCVAISEVLERAAKKDGGALAEYLEEVKIKTATPSKYVEVKVTSLGLEPETATAGGAPSVTAAVLKKLAGDPFADPPRYGTVSNDKRVTSVPFSKQCLINFIFSRNRRSIQSVRMAVKPSSASFLLARSTQ